MSDMLEKPTQKRKIRASPTPSLQFLTSESTSFEFEINAPLETCAQRLEDRAPLIWTSNAPAGPKVQIIPNGEDSFHFHVTSIGEMSRPQVHGVMEYVTDQTTKVSCIMTHSNYLSVLGWFGIPLIIFPLCWLILFPSSTGGLLGWVLLGPFIVAFIIALVIIYMIGPAIRYNRINSIIDGLCSPEPPQKKKKSK